MATYLPRVGDVGYYSLSTPFYNLSTQKLECIGISKLSDLRVKLDVLNSVFLDNGMSREDYDIASENDETIVKVVSPDGSEIYIPVSKFTSYVTTNVVEYKKEVLCIDLGALPAEINTLHILNEMKLMAESIVGNECESFVVEGEITEIIDEETHQALELERTSNVNSSVNPYKTIEEQALRIEQLEEYLRIFQDQALDDQ